LRKMKNSPNPAPAAATSQLPVSGMAMARRNAAITCSRNNGPIVGMVR